jgi:lysozyme
MNTYKINEEGIRMIKYFESLRLESYQDSVGVWTIGWGHTNKDKVVEGIKITQEEADAYLKADLKRFEDGVNELVKAPLSDNQFSALVSFSFNLGLGNLKNSTLLALLNRGETFNASKEFVKWSKAGGQRLSGLVKRRLSERNLFCSFNKPIVSSLNDDWKKNYLTL